MTPAEQDKAFKKAVKLAAGERGAIQNATQQEVIRLLEEASAAVTAALEAQPSDFMAWYLPQLRKQIELTLGEFGAAAGQAATAGQARAWGAGQALIDKPLAAAQVRLMAELPRLDTRPLLAMQLFLTGKMKDVGLDTLNKVNGELALTVIGAQGVSTTIERIQEVMGGVSRRRAIMIVRTEVGRAFAAASQQRSEQAAAQVPGLRKQWRRSGKIHSRLKHDLTDGQVRPVDQPFILGTGHVSDPETHGGIRIMYPHDPAAPPAETINCGCISLPYMASWKDAGVLTDPGKRPFSEREIALNPAKQELAGPGLTIGEIILNKYSAPASWPIFNGWGATLDEMKRLGGERFDDLLDTELPDAVAASVAGWTAPPGATLRDAMKLSSLPNTVVSWMRETVLSRVGQVRAMGGVMPVLHQKSGIGVDLMKRVARKLPNDWVKHANQYTLHVDVSKHRGYFSSAHWIQSKQELRRYIRTDSSSTAEHEFMHHIQHADPKLDALFAEEHHLRTASDAVEQIYPGIKGLTKEVGKPDNYVDRYQGREYSGKPLEVITMAFQALLGEDARANNYLHAALYSDQDMLKLILGTLFHYSP